MGGRGKAASNAGSSGRHEMTDSTPRTPLIGPDIEARAGGHEAQIMNTKSAREEAFLDTLGLSPREWFHRCVYGSGKRCSAQKICFGKPANSPQLRYLCN